MYAYLELLRGQNPHYSVQMATQSLESVLQEQKEYKKVDPLLLSEATTIKVEKLVNKTYNDNEGRMIMFKFLFNNSGTVLFSHKTTLAVLSPL